MPWPRRCASQASASAWPRKAREDEVRLRLVAEEAERAQLGREPGAQAGVLAGAEAGPDAVADCGLGRLELGVRQVERAADAVQDVDDRLRAVAPADAQAAEAVELGEGARHHDVAARVDHAGAAVVALGELGIGAVEDEDRARAAGRRRAARSRPSPIMVPVGLAGVGDEDEPRRRAWQAARIASTSTTRSRSGTSTGVAPAASAEMRCMAKPWRCGSPRRQGRRRPGRGR